MDGAAPAKEDKPKRLCKITKFFVNISALRQKKI